MSYNGPPPGKPKLSFEKQTLPPGAVNCEHCLNGMWLDMTPPPHIPEECVLFAQPKKCTHCDGKGYTIPKAAQKPIVSPPPPPKKNTFNVKVLPLKPPLLPFKGTIADSIDLGIPSKPPAAKPAPQKRDEPVVPLQTKRKFKMPE